MPSATTEPLGERAWESAFDWVCSSDWPTWKVPFLSTLGHPGSHSHLRRRRTDAGGPRLQQRRRRVHARPRALAQRTPLSGITRVVRAWVAHRAVRAQLGCVRSRSSLTASTRGASAPQAMANQVRSGAIAARRAEASRPRRRLIPWYLSKRGRPSRANPARRARAMSRLPRPIPSAGRCSVC